MIIENLFYTTSGVFGTPLGISATFIFMFVLFGKILEITGGGQFFINLALSGMGKYRGGPAKTAVAGSALMGSISGSAVANTVTTGSITIPLMKKTGYNKDFAGGVEAVASTGGQAMPPIMGASAFIIASYIGVPYIELAIAAIIPAILYYICVYFQVDFRARKLDLKGMPKNELPEFKKVFKEGFLYLLPLIIIIFYLAKGYSPMRAGFFGIVSVLIATGGTALLNRKIVKKKFSRILKGSSIMIWKGLDLGARAVIETAIACGAAGIIIGLVSLTGIGLKFSSLVINLSGGHLTIALILTMVASIILGMGLPTVAAYLVQVALTVPALIEFGVDPLAAHMFVFYFAIISAITPPVALAAYAASGIAKSNPMSTSIAAFKLGIAGFVLPYMFVYGSELLLIGEPHQILWTTITALVGLVITASVVEGWLMKKCSLLERIILSISVLALIIPEVISDFLGLFILLIILVKQFTGRKKLEYEVREDVVNN